MKTLPRSFYARDTVTVAKELLGKTLVHKVKKDTLSGIITETEAYRFEDDAASHAYRGMTKRNKAMFGEVGRSYVYFTYGMHYCFNVVARQKGFEAGAVLIRGLKPIQGINKMMRNRTTDILSNLTSGPAKLTQALEITKEHYGEDLTKPESLFITEGLGKKKIISNQRIGIKNGVDKLWNFKIQIS